MPSAKDSSKAGSVRYKAEPIPDQMQQQHHHPHSAQQAIPPPHLQQHQHQHQRQGVLQQHHPHPDSPHQSESSQVTSSGPYPSPHIPSHSLPPHNSPYTGSVPTQSGAVPYYAQHPFNNPATAPPYSSSVEPNMASATMNRYPPIYTTPSTQSPASVQSPPHHHDTRPMYSQPMYGYPPAYSVPQQTYGQHPVQPAGPMASGFMSQQPGQQIQHPSHSVAPALTGSPGGKLPQAQIQRPGTGMSPTTAAPPGQVPPPGLQHGQGPGVNPNAAPGPIPATTPLVVRQDQNGVQWIAFEYSRDRVKMEYTIRCDVESVDVNSLSLEFKSENCVYPRACCPKDQYKGNRLHYESECNTVGWALAQLNPCLRGKRGLIQRAVDSWRNSNQDPRLRSRRVRRMAKMNTRKATQVPQHHMAAPEGPGVSTAGLAPPGPRPPSMGMGVAPMLHQGGVQDDATNVPAGNDYNQGSHTHHHQAPNGHGQSSNDIRQTHNFYPTFPTPANGMVQSAIPPSDGMHVSGHPPVHSAITTSSKQEEEDNSALFGDLPEAKRRKFILVDDTQRGTRVRVRVMLDQVKMAEMPDSYRKSNSVYPRSWFATEMQSPPSSPRRGRWPDDVDNETDPASRTLVPVPVMDGSEMKVAVPKMTRARRNKEAKLNDLGYRMSWSQSRVFSGRSLFLQRSLDAYRNKMRSTMVAAGQDVSTAAPHFETRVGKRKWLERQKRTKRDSTP